MKTIAIINQKGGVGKTACAYNVAYALAVKQKRTLLVDLDPSGNATKGTIPETYLVDAYTVKHVILHKCRPEQAILAGGDNYEVCKYLSIIPSRIDLAMAQRELISKPYREMLLSRQLFKIAENFDYCIIDCCPTLSDLTINAIFAAHEFIIPITYENDALEGMADLFKVINEIKEEKLYQFKILRNQYDKRKSKTNDYIERKLSDLILKDHVFKTVIRQDENINQAKIESLPIFLYAPQSNGAKDFNALTEEIINV